MIKTLRITSVAVAALAVLLLVLPVVFGSYTDSRVEEFLNSPSAVEQFQAGKSPKAPGGKDQTPPLVKQAQAFALYLNPPPPPSKRARKTSSTAARTKRPPKPKPVIKPKFKLVAISFHASRPDLSRALIDQPGEGYRWVRESAKVGHLVIDQIKDGLVVIRDKDRLEELPVADRPKIRSLIKGADVGKTPSEAAVSSVVKSEVVMPAPSETTSTAKAPEITGSSNEETALMDDLVKNLKGQLDSTGGEEEKDVLIQKLMSDLQTMNVGAEEAEKLDRLGKELNKIQRDPNKISNRRIRSDTRRRGRPRTRRPRSK